MLLSQFCSGDWRQRILELYAYREWASGMIYKGEEATALGVSTVSRVGTTIKLLGLMGLSLDLVSASFLLAGESEGTVSCYCC